MKSLVIQTELFFTDIPDEQLGSWFLGGDCAGWFYARLLPLKGIRQHLCPTMEDWGWIMGMEVNGVVVQICVWEYLDQEKLWVLGIGARKKFFKKADPSLLKSAEEIVVDGLSAILQSDERFLNFKWFDKDPNEMIGKVFGNKGE